MNDDPTLLRRYADTGDDQAFAELVRRYVDLVYAAALRRTGGASDLAADVAQEVFTALARKARRVSRHPVLSAWLHTATRYAAINLMLAEQRRKNREREAFALDPALASGGAGEPAWEQLRPVLDAAIDELPQNDRAAVVLRFLEKRPFAEIGAVLRVSEDAARARTDRALDKLRASLERRGVNSSAAALGTLVGAQATLAAPAGLAATLATTATATAAGGGLLAGNLLGILFMNTKLAATVAFCALLAFIAGLYFGIHRTLAATQPPPAPSTDVRTLAALRASRDQLEAELSRLRLDLARLTATPKTPPPAAPAPVPTVGTPAEQQRTMLNNLRMLSAAADQFFLENERVSASYADLVGNDKYVRQIIPADGENYAGLAFIQGAPMTVTTRNGVTASYGDTSRPALYPPTAEAAETMHGFGPTYNRALRVYKATNQNQSPPSAEALLPYFATAPEAAEFQRANALLLTEAGSTLSPAWRQAPSWRLPPELKREGDRLSEAHDAARQAYRASHGGQNTSDQKALLPYFPTPQQAADYVELLDAIDASRKAALATPPFTPR